jgi:agmatine deiminase
MNGKTPRSQGYHMPAEWEHHEGTWLIWPHNDTFEGHQLRLEHLWLEMTSALHEHETVHIIVTDDARGEHLQNQLRYYGLDENNIAIYIIPNDDVWARDCGPIFVVNRRGELAVTTWNFNGWGERYPYSKDCLVPARVADKLSVTLYTGPITLEGGGIEVNGKGTLLATRSSIINPNRNPNVSQGEIEAAIKDYLGINHFIWLSGAPRDFCDIVGSDTDLHVDAYARFTDDSTVLYAWTDDETHIFYPYLKRHRDELRVARTETGKPLTLVPLRLPENRMYSTQTTSTRPPFKNKASLAGYANFYIANNVVLVPIYGDINDANAKSIIAEHFPDRDIIGIPSLATAELGGMMHCVTQQQPISKKEKEPIRKNEMEVFDWMVPPSNQTPKQFPDRH